MAQIGYQGSSAFQHLVYAPAHPATLQFIASQFEAPTHILTEAGAKFMQGARQVFERVTSTTTAMMARAAKRAFGSIWQRNEIQPLLSIDVLQHAPLCMQPYLMAEPETRALYHKQLIDGYSDTYTDAEPGLVGVEHYHYRRVMDGVVQFREDGSWFAQSWQDDLLPDDVQIELDQQVDILDSWEALRAEMRKRKEDPTSKFNALM